jgi:hypothetical protein
MTMKDRMTSGLTRGRTFGRVLGLSFLALAIVAATGCHGRQKRSPEPTLDMGAPIGSLEGPIVQVDPPHQVSGVDRHPLLAAPRDMYNNTNSNKIVKVGAATVVGVPMGLYGEVKQIFVGVPPSLQNTSEVVPVAPRSASPDSW